MRSADAALDFFASLKQLGSEGTLEQKMLSKASAIVLQVGKEIDTLSRVFQQNKVQLYTPSLRMERDKIGAHSSI
jgi:hypothetical protein